jgi:phospholipase/lecithinase/hemolysin
MPSAALSQIGRYLSVNSIADANALYVVMGGWNDSLALPAGADEAAFDAVAGDVINNLVGAVATLHAAGARQFLLPLLPDIGAAPAVVDPTVRFILFDTDAAQQALVPAFGNSTDACLQPTLGTVCGDPGRFFFWDDLHQTAAVNALMGAQLAQRVPEPGVLALVLMALPLLARRRAMRP